MFKQRLRQDQGFSLVEVLIAVVVLGVAGVALLSGLQTALLSGKKMDDRAGALIAMNAAAQIINTVPYQSCIYSQDGTSALPYKSLEFSAGVNNQNSGNAGYSLPEGVEVIAVQGLVGSVASVTDPTKLGQWVDCKSWVNSSTSNPIPTVAQRIKLSVVSQGRTFTRDLLRFYSTTKDIYGGLSGLFRVCAQGSGLKGEVVSLFCGKPYSMSTYVTGSTATFNLSVLDLPAGGSAIYSIQQLSGQSDSIATIAGTSVTVRPNTSNKLLPTYSYQIDALDPVSGYFALPLALEVTVWKPPTITTTSLSDASEGKAYSQTLSADGGAGALTFSVVSGSLPAGLTLDRGSGLISGTPTAGTTTGTRSTFSVIVTDSNGVSSDPASLSITTYLPPVISTTSLAQGTAGRSYTATVISTQGAGDLKWSLNGPTGMTISTSGALAWNSPTAGTYSITVTVNDRIGGTDSKTFSLKINSPPIIGLADCKTSWTAGFAYSCTPTVTGGTSPLLWSVSGNSGSGLALNTSTGVLSGTPVAGTYTITFTVTDGAGATDTEIINFSVNAPLTLTITSTNCKTTWTENRLYTCVPTLTGGTAPFTWSVTGADNSGLSLSASGILSGTAKRGTYTIRISVTDSVGGTASQSYTLTVNPALTISISACKTSWTAGFAYSCTPTVTGGTSPLLWSVSGNSGSGLALNTSTGVLSGTPVAGTYTITVAVTDAIGAATTETLSLAVNSALTMTLPSTNCKTTWTENRLYTCVPTLTGGTAPFTWSVTGADNSGLSLSASGILSGTAKRGTYTIRISVTDSVGGTASQSYTLTVNPALTISISACKTSWTAGFAYSCTPTVTGGTSPLLWSVSGNSGSGLALNTSTGVLSGTPVAGTYTITVEAEDASLSTDSKSYTFTVNPSPVVTLPTENCPRSWTSGASYTCRPSLAGGTPSFIWSITGLPRNSTLTINSTTGELSGTPVAGTFTFSVQDSTGATATALYTLTVNAVPTLTYSCNAGTAFQNFNCSPTITGGTNPFAFAISSGSLPSGLSQNSATGVISGIPTTPGSTSMTIRATDLAGASATHNLTLTINPALTLSLSNCPKVWTAGRNYSCTPTRTGGISPFSWTLSSGTLPAGLTLNSTTGVISGTPTTANTYTATIKVQDANTAFAEESLTIQINPALTVSIPASTCKSVWTANKSYSCLPTSTGGTGSVTWTVSGITGSGLTFDNQSVALTGSTPNSGNYTITFGVTDSIGATASASYTLTVNGAVVLSTSNCASGWTVNRPYSCTPTRTGGTSPFSWSISSGSLPTGLTLNAVSGIISGTPTTSGVSSVTIVVRDDVGSEAQSALTITINPSVTVSVASCATTGNTRSTYSCSPSRTGGTSPFTWSVSGNSGSGLTINASTGVLSGTLPSKAGTYTITITVTDIAGSSASGTFTLTVK